MVCKNCGKEVDDSSKFCEYCGKTVVVTKNNYEQQYEAIKAEQKKKNKKILTAVIIIVAICVVLSIVVTINNSVGYYNSNSTTTVKINNLEDAFKEIDREKLIKEANELATEQSYGMLEIADFNVKENTIEIIYKFSDGTGITKNDDIAKEFSVSLENEKDAIMYDIAKGGFSADDDFAKGLMALGVYEITFKVIYQDCNGEELWSANKSFYVKDFV